MCITLHSSWARRKRGTCNLNSGLGQFSLKKARAIAKYKDYVREGVGLPPVWGNLKQQIYLGDGQFVEQMQKHPAESF
tara:strand:+ start:2670 stop:2903 length:234 start_codon:yes stop_codon:yes gene_type:complete